MLGTLEMDSVVKVTMLSIIKITLYIQSSFQISMSVILILVTAMLLVLTVMVHLHVPATLDSLEMDSVVEVTNNLDSKDMIVYLMLFFRYQ